MKTKVIILSVLAALSVVLVMMLRIYSNASRPALNGFDRAIVGELSAIGEILNAGESSYFAGVSEKTIWLGDHRDPLKLIALSLDDGTRSDHQIVMPNPVRASRIMVDSAHFYLADLTLYKIYRGSTNSWALADPIYQGTLFSEFIPLGNSSMFMRTILDNEFELIKKTQPDITIENRNVLQKQIDGLFCVDGALRYDRHMQRLVYVYFHRNEFICLDTALQIVFRGSTIDTTRLAKMRVAELTTRHASSLASPAYLVNRKVIVADSTLYINSLLKGDNESAPAFSNASAIDMYALSSGKYIGSFYLPYYHGKRSRHFTIVGKRLLSLHDGHLLIYSLPRLVP
ncbi:MAG: hypothetical protein J0L67_04075 [Cytophagales bacterium]|nr:hypothetical protein [Cytophagales bacterium]